MTHDDSSPTTDAQTKVAPRGPASRGGAVRFLIRVLDGPEAGVTAELEPTEPVPVLVGTSPSCGLRLTDPLVSRRHLALEPTGDRLRVTDLNSTNGTSVNGVPLLEVLLRGGERLELGETVLHLQAVMADDEPVPLAARFGKLVGASPAMRKLYPLCERLAQSTVPVVIEGETGTGKEVLAESLHDLGPRASKPFIVFDCTSVAPSLMEAALFGHEKGAFTSANQMRTGVFEQAHGGTLLIDEIGDLDIALQAKLLRALERSEVRRIGGSKWIKVDVRVLAATRRDLDREVQEGRFRDDLFFRLAVARIELPPLRKREGDVEVLARVLWRQMTQGTVPVPQDFLDKLASYRWPGNVRELQNAVARRVALGDLVDMDTDGALSGAGRALEAALGHTQEHTAVDFVTKVLAKALPIGEARQLVVADFERRYVDHILEVCGGNVGRAAEAAGVALRYFHVIKARTRPRGG